CRVRPGTGRIIDIEREVELGGPLHSQGVLVPSGFLAGRYALDRRMSLSASLAPFREYLRRERVRHELSLLNDRELSDICMTRDEISEIFKPEFAARRAADRL
ncbi:MAG: DUF1127 domain-containing protein, partial [Acetobacteraceae bacterium]